MNLPFYRGSFLARTSVAFLLYEAAKKSGDPKDWKKLDTHMRQLDIEYEKLHGVMPNV
jgi:hypothetical protein